SDFEPTKAELDVARDLIERFGEADTTALVPFLVRQVKEHWPDAKSFVAVTRYTEEALAELWKKQRRDEKEVAEAQAATAEREAEALRAQERAALRRVWDTLPPGEQAVVRARVLAAQPD